MSAREDFQHKAIQNFILGAVMSATQVMTEDQFVDLCRKAYDDYRKFLTLSKTA